MENPVSSNIKGTPDLENYIKELLLKNKRTLILNYEEVVKGIHDKVSHLNGALTTLEHYRRRGKSCTSRL